MRQPAALRTMIQKPRAALVGPAKITGKRIQYVMDAYNFLPFALYESKILVKAVIIKNTTKLMKKTILSLTVLGIVLGVPAVLFTDSVFATHTVCSPESARAGEPVPHGNAHQVESFCAAGAADVDKPNADAKEYRVESSCKKIPLDVSNCVLLKDYVVPAINALAASVGIVVVIMVAWGGFQYTTSRDNPQQAAQAKNHVQNAIIALVMYIFMIAFLNWLVPGGVF